MWGRNLNVDVSFVTGVMANCLSVELTIKRFESEVEKEERIRKEEQRKTEKEERRNRLEQKDHERLKVKEENRESSSEGEEKKEDPTVKYEESDDSSSSSSSSNCSNERDDNNDRDVVVENLRLIEKHCQEEEMESEDEEERIESGRESKATGTGEASEADGDGGGGGFEERWNALFEDGREGEGKEIWTTWPSSPLDNKNSDDNDDEEEEEEEDDDVIVIEKEESQHDVIDLARKKKVPPPQNPSSPPPPPPPVLEIIVSNIPPHARPLDLRVYFALAGKVSRVMLPQIPNVSISNLGRYRNWAKVEFEEHASVEKAKEGVKVWEMFLGRRLEVKVGGKEEGERRREEGRRGVKRAVSEPVGGGGGGLKRTISEPPAKFVKVHPVEEKRKEEERIRVKEKKMLGIDRYVSIGGFPNNFDAGDIPRLFSHVGKVVSYTRALSRAEEERKGTNMYYVEFEDEAGAAKCVKMAGNISKGGRGKAAVYDNLFLRRPHYGYENPPFHGIVRFSLPTLPVMKPLESVKLYSKKNVNEYTNTIAGFFAPCGKVYKVVFTVLNHNQASGYISFKPSNSTHYQPQFSQCMATSLAIKKNGESLCGKAIMTYFDRATKKELKQQIDIVGKLREESGREASL
ncbi:hypothetical protein TrVE_jg4930 [Triparma verrucosa]|uniref:RRM domain-containing protein n=1 Tax=Triparma verrucosa TaxID=1606542 RepID=A0A9W7FFM6_9STRA|nr:hypothetical protein TrVE_jg4930 [Triparma verrucosa]